MAAPASNCWRSRHERDLERESAGPIRAVGPACAHAGGIPALRGGIGIGKTAQMAVAAAGTRRPQFRPHHRSPGPAQCRYGARPRVPACVEPCPM
ncbi:hypothetical protein G6F63_016108 [Rhizopus arrhizus]|nr:hypothetical protein G6F63_016108 [Rhizopus arrhizus]